ncbi:MAG: response regulator [Alphaproteobacteria bacterium]|nr:response regulator [Alphaproteobacteria bacterium]
MRDLPNDGDERLCILILESDIIVRTEIAEYLRDCGYKVIEAVTGDEAMIMLDAPGVRIKAILADVKAAGSTDGFGLARWIRTNRHEINVILTGTVEKAAKEAGDLCEDGPILSKPYDPQVVLDRIKRLLAARHRNA